MTKLLDLLTDDAIGTEGLLPGQTPIRDTSLSKGGRATSRFKDTVQGFNIDWDAWEKAPANRKNFYYVNPKDVYGVIRKQFKNYVTKPEKYGLTQESTLEDVIKLFDQERPQNKIKKMIDRGIDVGIKIKNLGEKFDLSWLNIFGSTAYAAEVSPDQTEFTLNEVLNSQPQEEEGEKNIFTLDEIVNLPPKDMEIPQLKEKRGEMRKATPEEDVQDFDFAVNRMAEQIFTATTGITPKEGELGKKKFEKTIGLATSAVLMGPIYAMAFELYGQAKSAVVSALKQEEYSPLERKVLTELLPEDLPTWIKGATYGTEVISDIAIMSGLSTIAKEQTLKDVVKTIGQKLQKAGYGEGQVRVTKEAIKEAAKGTSLDKSMRAWIQSKLWKPVQKAPEVAKIGTAAPTTQAPVGAVVSVPKFKNTEQAIAFGKTATPEQVAQMQDQRLALLKETEVLKLDNSDEAMQKGMDLAVEAQFLREAVESAPKAELTAADAVKQEPISYEQSVVQKITEALKQAKPIRGQQETLYTKERGIRMAKAMSVGEKTSGEKGFFSELGQLKGELPKVEFEAIRDKLNQEEIDVVFNMVKDNKLLGFWEKITARTGLSKLFGQYGGTVPTKGELTLLNKVFGNEFVETLLEKRPVFEQFKDALNQVINIPRSVMASFDLSAPMRQGVFFVGRKEFYKAFPEMFKYFGSETAFKAINEEIATRPSFDLMKDSKLALTEMDALLEDREEAYMSNWAEKIPLVGGAIRASGRAYVGFLNKLRADVFDDMINKAQGIGLNPYENRDLAKEMAIFINAATGRGPLGSLERAGVNLNSVFFSPRLIASRLTLLNPVYYAKLSPFVRKEALKSLLSFAGFAATALGLLALGGAEVGTDPRSSDFLKAKIRNTRIDFLGGFQQYMRMMGQLISGKYVSSTTGRIITLGEGYKPITRLQIIERQIKGKLSPAASFIVTLLEGQDWAGKKIKVTDEIKNRMTPMVLQDLNDLLQEDPDLLPIGALGIFGVGVQTYGSPKKRKKKD